jgi:acetylornithine deacetylase
MNEEGFPVLKADEERALTADAVELLSRLIATPRVSRDEGRAADIMASAIENEGFECRREANNVWTVAPGYDAQRPTLLLNAHLDTVKPVSTWTRAPFTPFRDGDRLYGLGSNDDGGGLVTLWQVFRVMSRRPRTYNLVFLASAEEEVSGQDGVRRALPLLPPVSVAIVGEPTGMQPAIAERGLMVLDVTAHGRAGHAARDEGDNAIYRAMDDIGWFRTHQWPLVSPMLGPVKMTVTVIQAGTQHNVVPDECRFTVDVRTNECYQNEALYALICREVKSEVRARSFRLNSSHIAPGHPLVRRAVALGGKPFGSPTLSDQALMPFPSMKMGPGQSSRSHTADEFVTESEIDEAITHYITLLDGLDIRP